MKVVILGAGQVGGSLSANLSSNGYDVTVIDSNDEKLSDLDSRLDLRTVSGHASHPITLKRAGCDSDTILLALTCLLYTSPSPRDTRSSRMPSSA